MYSLEVITGTLNSCVMKQLLFLSRDNLSNWYLNNVIAGMSAQFISIRCSPLGTLSNLSTMVISMSPELGTNNSWCTSSKVIFSPFFVFSSITFLQKSAYCTSGTFIVVSRLDYTTKKGAVNGKAKGVNKKGTIVVKYVSARKTR